MGRCVPSIWMKFLRSHSTQMTSMARNRFVPFMVAGGGGVGGHHLLLKTTGVNLTNTMNKFSMAILNKDLSSIHSSQQPLEPIALQAGLCTNAPVTKLSVFCPFPEGCCHPCVTGRKTGYREYEKLTQSHRPSELEKYNPRVHLKSPGP